MRPPTPAALRQRLRFEHERSRMRVVSYVLLAPVFLYIGTDLMLTAGNFDALIRLAALRVSMVAVVIAAMERVAREESEEAFARYLSIGCLLTSAIALSIHLMRPRGLIAPFFADLVSLFGVYLLLADRWQRALFPALTLTIADLLLLFFWHQGATLPVRLAITVSFVITNALGITYALQRARLHEAMERLMESQTGASTTP